LGIRKWVCIELHYVGQRSDRASLRQQVQ